MQKENIRAIALMSGGLDSTLAAKLIKEQGIEVVGLHLSSPFGCLHDVEASAKAIGVPLVVKDKGEAYLDLVKNPTHGYGKNLNPCVDCRSYMFKIAKKVMAEKNAHFIVTGEVLGQRHMSQLRDSISLIDGLAQNTDEVLRPLSAHFFPPTKAETKGWVDREKLLKISGRSRKKQMAQVERLGLTGFAPPGGGCLLTEKDFSKRLADFFERDDGEARLERSALLRLGRHFRIAEKLRVIVGRNQAENLELQAQWKGARASFFRPKSFMGPAVVGFGPVAEAQRKLIGQLMVRYGNVSPNQVQEIEFKDSKQTLRYQVEGAVEMSRLEAMRI